MNKNISQKYLSIYKCVLKKTSKRKPILSRDLVSVLNMACLDKDLEPVFDRRTIRLYTHYCRVSLNMPIIANNSGYFYSQDGSLIRMQIKKTQSAIKSMQEVVKSYKKMLK